MAGTMVEIPAGGSPLPGYLSLPPTGRGPGVVVVQEWWGLVPHIRAVADRLAIHGFAALAPDLYRGKEALEPDEAKKMQMELDLPAAARDLAAAVDYLLELHEVDDDRVGVIGFCMGGGLALTLAAQKPEVTATVAFYGLPSDLGSWDASPVQGAVLGHFAEHDHIPAEGVEELESKLRAAGTEVTIHRYPGTSHAFFNDDRPEVFDADAAETSWKRTLEFLGRGLGVEA